MSETTPGRAAYEAWQHARYGDDRYAAWDSGALSDKTRSAWDAAAQAAIKAALVDAGLSQLRAEMERWPLCPDGCGCRLGTEDADPRDCACDGPCCTECREMGYPDAPSYRDLAVKHVMDERDDLRALVAEILGEFSARQGDGFRARIGQVQMARHCERAGVTPKGRAGLEATP